MKIIEALKTIKDLQRKASDIRIKIATFCADLETETPAYGTLEIQTKQIAEWLQSHADILTQIETLRIAIQQTNLKTLVPIVLRDDKPAVVKSIANWIHRRHDLASLSAQAWLGLTNRNIKPMNYKPSTTSDEVKTANVRKYYSQQTRDFMVELYTSEPSRIDSALEITNATTDLIF